MRADLYLFRRGFASSREAARKAILAGLCFVDGRKIGRPSEDIPEEGEHEVRYEPAVPYVSRGGLKLEAALDAFGVDPSGMLCLDIGASTGGFTDCLLRRGAAGVTCVDSGHGQLAEVLRRDPRVTSIEGKNARDLAPADVGGPFGLAVMDVSFISQTLILPRIPACLLPDGMLISLIKPQFECGPGAVGKGGIVKSPGARRAACVRVRDAAAACGLQMIGIAVSPVEGGDGNREYLAVFSRGAAPSPFAIPEDI